MIAGREDQDGRRGQHHHQAGEQERRVREGRERTGGQLPLHGPAEDAGTAGVREARQGQTRILEYRDPNNDLPHEHISISEESRGRTALQQKKLF